MNKIFKVALIVALIIVVYMLQLFVIDTKHLFSIKPNLILVLCISFSICLGGIGGCIFSLLTGVFLDLLYGTSGFGIYTFLYSVVGIVALKIKSGFKENIFSAIYIMVILCVIFEALQSLALLFEYKVQVGLFLFVFRTLLFVILNAGFMAIIYSILSKVVNSEKEYSSFNT